MRRTTLPAGGTLPPTSVPWPRPLARGGPCTDSELSRAVPGTVDQDGETITPGLRCARVLREQLSAVADVRRTRRTWAHPMTQSCDPAGRIDQPSAKPDSDCRTLSLRGAA